MIGGIEETSASFEARYAPRSYPTAYTAFDLNETTPSPGDLLCAAREDPNFAIDDLKSFRKSPDHGSYHCDIVVGFDNADGKKAGVVYGIGGNVINAVSLTEALIHNGRVAKVRTPSGRNWFAVLKLQDGTRSRPFQVRISRISTATRKSQR